MDAFTPATTILSRDKGVSRLTAVGESVRRKEAENKVSGAAKYNDDFTVPGMLYATLRTSTKAHATLRFVDKRKALQMPGVRAVLLGEDAKVLCGEVLADRPPLAKGRVRYSGEPIALVVADSEAQAMAAAAAIDIAYDPLPVVNSPLEAAKPGAPVIHPELGSYTKEQSPIYPQAGTNICDSAHIRKGDMARGWQEAEVVVEGDFTLPQIDHAAMETRSARVEILPDGRVQVFSSTQAPFEVQKLLSKYFAVPQGQVVVSTPLVGGAFGGKTSVNLEVLAYMASKAVGGRLVRLANTREQDIATSPVGVGMQARMKLGATRDGRLAAAEMAYWLDTGAYTDSTPRVARAIAANCTGPYRVPNVHCDVNVVYTNHVFTTAYRGFGHINLTFTVERIMEKLAHALGVDPLELRKRNVLEPGDTTPTTVRLTRSNLGDTAKCLERTAELIGWTPGSHAERIGPHTVRAHGIAAFWKTSSSPPDAISGALITMNKDGTMNLATGTVEFGAGTKTTAAQILAERMGMDVDQIHIHSDVNTKVDPEHWKTVASMSTYMSGRAVLEAAEDVIRQLKSVAATVLRCPPEDLEVGGGRVYLRDDPQQYVAFKDIAHGYKYQEGDSIGGQVMGRGSFIMRHLTLLDQKTGQGRPGPAWTVGATAVEVDLDTRDFTYRIRRAATVMDAGKVINPRTARGVVMGGMNMGLGYGSRESMLYSDQGEVLNGQLRLYKLMRYGEQPEYLVDFVETPQVDSPYGARPIGEHGNLAAPAALANALSVAAGVPIDELPATPEHIWRATKGVHR